MLLKLLYTLIPTILIELAVLWLLREKRRKVLLASVAINVLSNVPLNLYLLYVASGIKEIIIGEVIVVVVETLWYLCFVKNLKQAFIYSLLCNAISFLLGVLVQLIDLYCNIGVFY